MLCVGLLMASGCSEESLPTVELNEKIQAGSDIGKHYISIGESFDINSSNLGSDFKGHSLSELGNLLAGSRLELQNPNKDEFETIVQYNKRIASLNVFKDVFGWDPKSHYFAFVSMSTGNETIQYDADNKTLNVNLSLFSWNQSITQTSNEYRATGRNAFGVEVDVSYLDSVETILKMIHLDQFKEFYESSRTQFSMHKYDLPYMAITPKWLFYDGDRELNTVDNLIFSRSIPMDLEVARATKSDLRLLIIGELESPYIQVTSQTSNPTLDHPSAGEKVKRNIVTEVKQIWLYNSNTGDVVAKWPKDSDLKSACHFEMIQCPNSRKKQSS